MGIYENNYNDLKLYNESLFISLAKGIVGAIIGAVPGMLLWIVLGKLGITASLCGLVLTLGSIFGYMFMTKNSSLSPVFGIIICFIIMGISVYLSERIVWSWELMSIFENIIPNARASLREEISILNSSLSQSEIDELLTDDAIEEMVVEVYGFSEGTFSNCFSHFNDLLEILEIKSDFYSSLGKSYLFAFVGGFAGFAKLGK